MVVDREALHIGHRNLCQMIGWLTHTFSTRDSWTVLCDGGFSFATERRCVGRTCTSGPDTVCSAQSTISVISESVQVPV
ncbi:hypothetical protein C8Q70DRAFT_1027611, partial [Cubamyces menziesii]